MRVVFVSGPYRGNISENIRIARQHAEMLWAKGYAVFCPHLNSAHMDGCAPDKAFLDGDIEILSRCDAIYMLPGWEQSEGARSEYAHALLHGIEVLKPLDNKK
jgi:hypothetical protein